MSQIIWSRHSKKLAKGNGTSWVFSNEFSYTVDLVYKSVDSDDALR